MEFKNTLLLLAQDFNQSEYGLAWGLVLGLIFLGVLAVCIPRPRKTVPKSMQAEEEKKSKRKKMIKSKKKKKKKS